MQALFPLAHCCQPGCQFRSDSRSPFVLRGEKGFLKALKDRMLDRRHAVIVVAEGAGQDLLDPGDAKYDASGNMILKDIGIYLKQEIGAYFKEEKIPVVIRYFDPSYSIRSCPADAEDSILCDLFARNAVHAAMAGKTGLVIGFLHDTFIHIPVELLTGNHGRLICRVGNGEQRLQQQDSRRFFNNPLRLPMHPV